MRVLAGLFGLAIIGFVLTDAFEAMILPRRVGRRFRPARLFYIFVWRWWSLIARRMKPSGRRGMFLSVFGPLSLLMLLTCWALGLVTGFALTNWAADTHFHTPEGRAGLGTFFYVSGVTFFTLGYGDIYPLNTGGRALAVAESGIGFGFLAVVIGYLPVVYQTFSRREIPISMLDARAGSPPTAAQLLLRLAQGGRMDALDGFLEGWERWCAELLEGQLSFPSLTYYRSQHDNQSWLGAITAILDACALVLAALPDVNPFQAQATFAAARHALVDTSLIFLRVLPLPSVNRLSRDQLEILLSAFAKAGLHVREADAVEDKLHKLRAMYEPFAIGLGNHFLFALPPVAPDREQVDNWQTSAFARRSPGFRDLAEVDEGHFE